MPEQFDSRAYDQYNTDLISDRDLTTSDRHAMYDARCTVIHEDRHWLVALIVASAVAVIGCITVPPFWQQVVAWMGW